MNASSGLSKKYPWRLSVCIFFFLATMLVDKVLHHFQISSALCTLLTQTNVDLSLFLCSLTQCCKFNLKLLIITCLSPVNDFRRIQCTRILTPTSRTISLAIVHNHCIIHRFSRPVPGTASFVCFERFEHNHSFPYIVLHFSSPHQTRRSERASLLLVYLGCSSLLKTLSKML